MPRPPSFPDFIEDELLRAPMTLDSVIDAVQERWRLRLPLHKASDGDPARALRQHRGDLIQQTLRTLRETAQADLRADFAPAASVPGLARPAPGRATRSADLSLIDDDDVAVDIEIARCTQAIKQGAEAELRDLHTYTSALVHDINVSRDTNPFGPERFARALWRGVQTLPLGRSLQAAFMRDAAAPLAEALRRAYASASRRLHDQGVAPAAYRTFVFGSGTAWGADLTRYRPSEDPTLGHAPAPLASDPPGGWPAPAPAPAPTLAPTPAPANSVLPAAPRLPAQRTTAAHAPSSASSTPLPPRADELLDRLFEAMLQERGLAASTQALLARLPPVMHRLVQTDPAPLAAYDHPAWRFISQMAHDIECCPPASLPRVLALCNSLVDHLAATQPLQAAAFTWAIVRLAATRQHALEQALAAAAPQVDRLQRIARDEASATSAAVPLDIGSLDTVPASLMPEPGPAPALAVGAFSLQQASAPGTHLRCHLQGRWRHLMTLWGDTDSELVLLLEPPTGRLWALRQSALARLLAETLVRPVRVRSLVRRAADRLLRASPAPAH